MYVLKSCTDVFIMKNYNCYLCIKTDIFIMNIYFCDAVHLETELNCSFNANTSAIHLDIFNDAYIMPIGFKKRIYVKDSIHLTYVKPTHILEGNLTIYPHHLFSNLKLRVLLIDRPCPLLSQNG